MESVVPKTFLTLLVMFLGVTAPAGTRHAQGSDATGLTEVAVDWRAWLTPVRGLVLGVRAIGEPVVAVATSHGVEVVLMHSGNGRLLRFVVPESGELAEADAEALAQFLRCRRTARVKRAHQGLVGLLADVARKYPGHTIEIMSGYRGTREESRTSPHRAGRAVDIRVHGVKTTEVRDWLWSTHHAVGVGWYPHSDFLHMDVRPGQKDTSWTQRSSGADNIYNPRWAYKARK
jgi:uncharacterized protein YcbK (DUF882 family)